MSCRFVKHSMEVQCVAKHEFGMMQKNPGLWEQFNSYEPERYDCIAVDDDVIEPLLADFQEIVCYWHTLQRKEKGLAYWGITLLPPESLEAFIKVFTEQNAKKLFPLIALMEAARAEGKYVIHFGI